MSCVTSTNSTTCRFKLSGCEGAYIRLISKNIYFFHHNLFFLLLSRSVSVCLQVFHRATTVALLIGLAAGRLGSCDPATSRDLGLHLPALLPPHSSLEFSTSLSVQTAALLGLGLLYQASGDRLRVEFLLTEIGRTARHGLAGTSTVKNDLGAMFC